MLLLTHSILTHADGAHIGAVAHRETLRHRVRATAHLRQREDILLEFFIAPVVLYRA